MTTRLDEIAAMIPLSSRKDEGGAASVASSGQVVVPAPLLARAGIELRQDVIVEADAGGVHILPDALRKVYVEATSMCDLACVQRRWTEQPAHMPFGRYERRSEWLWARGIVLRP